MSYFKVTPDDEVLNAEEAAKVLKISQSMLYKLTSRKEIPHRKCNGLKFFKREILDWLNKQKAS